MYNFVLMCFRGKAGKRTGVGSLNKSSLVPGMKGKAPGEKDDPVSGSQGAGQGRHGRPFHRRSTITDEFLQHDIDLMTQQMPIYGGARVSGGTTSQMPLRPTPNYESIDSPPSAAPSPLVATQPQPSQVTNGGDPTMPTLSPHPPAIKEEKLTPGGAASSSAGSNSQSESQDGVGSGAGTPGSAATTPGASTTPGGSSGNSGLPNGNVPHMVNGTGCGPDLFPSGSTSVKTPGAPGAVTPKSELAALLMDTVKVENVNSWLDSEKAKSGLNGGIKRPMLPGKSYDENQDELLTESLYDFNQLNAW